MDAETRYAQSGDISIAYQVTGDGPFDVVYAQPSLTHIELAWKVPGLAAWFRSLASFCRLIRFDKRGMGMSDRVSGSTSLEIRMDDLRAVMDACGSERAALYGSGEGGPMSILFAATYPNRVWALVLEGTTARSLWAPDYPWGIREEVVDLSDAEDRRAWGTPGHAASVVERLAPSADGEDKRALAEMLRQSVSPGALATHDRMLREIDVRNVLPAVHVPTLVLNRTDESRYRSGVSRYLAEHIANARQVELPGRDHAMFADRPELALGAIRQFLGDVWDDRGEQEESERVLATVLFTDLVDSTAKAVEVGDARWRTLVEAHHALVRRQLTRFRGREIDTAGDGFFAAFDGPARAIHCACAITGGLHDLGLDVRAGVHAGECEVVDGKIGGIAVHIGARVAANARAGEVLVSSTVKDLVAGSGIPFEDRGGVQLKGIPGEWRLFAVAQTI